MADLSNTTITGDLHVTGSVSKDSHTIKNTPLINADYTIGTTYNELTVGPIEIADGVTVTVEGEWVIL